MENILFFVAMTDSLNNSDKEHQWSVLRKKTEDTVFVAIEDIVAKSGLNAVTEDNAENSSKLFVKAFLERT